MSDFDPNSKEVQAAIKAALEEARSAWEADTEGLKAKNKELLTKLRSATEIKPEDLSAAEERADKAERALADLNKQVKALTTERDKAMQALEQESGAARNYVLENEVSKTIAKYGVMPEAFELAESLLKAKARTEIVDGKTVVMYGDQPLSEFAEQYFTSDKAKLIKAASANSGGGAPGGGGAGTGGKVITRAQFDAMNHVERAKFSTEGGKVVDQAA